MKQLFTLLDIENSGHVHIEDIAEHWSIDGAGAVLPPNIIPSLRKVTTPGGYLTFERFCAGLKIAILRHSAQRQEDRGQGRRSCHEDAAAVDGRASSPSGMCLRTLSRHRFISLRSREVGRFGTYLDMCAII